MSAAALRWEYASLVYRTWCEKVARRAHPSGLESEMVQRMTEEQKVHYGWVTPAGLTYHQEWWLNLPGKEPEQLDTMVVGEDPEPWPLMDQLAELGDEGWEMLSDTVVKSGINTHVTGWSTSSEPLQRTLFFRRPFRPDDV